MVVKWMMEVFLYDGNIFTGVVDSWKLNSQ